MPPKKNGKTGPLKIHKVTLTSIFKHSNTLTLLPYAIYYNVELKSPERCNSSALIANYKKVVPGVQIDFKSIFFFSMNVSSTIS